MRSRRRWLVGVFACALVWAGGATAAGADERGIDPNQGENLVEVNVPNKGAAMRLQLEAEKYGVDFNEHYYRQEADGSGTVTVFGTDDEIAALDKAGFEVGVTIEGREHVAQPDRRRARPTSARRTAPRTPRSASPSSRRSPHDGRDRRAARRLLRELRRPVPVGRGEDAHGRGATPTGAVYTRADAVALVGQRTGDADRARRRGR